MKSVVSTHIQLLLMCVLALATLSSLPERSHSLPRPTAELWVSGNVLLNGRTASSGMTVLNGNRIQTQLNGVATVHLGKSGRIKLEPDSELVLNLTPDGIGGELRTGQMGVQTVAGIGISVVTANGVVVSDNKNASALGLGVTKSETTVSAVRGTAKITLNNKVETVANGEEVTVGTTVKARRRKLPPVVALGAGAGAAASLAALAAESFSSTLTKLGAPGTTDSNPTTNQTGPNPVPTPYSPTQGNPLPSATPVTPVKPPPTANVCGVCSYDARDGRLINPGRILTICHRLPNGTGITQTIACSAAVGHFNLNGTPRPTHESDTCGPCSQ
jgi:hypothetical protein